MKVVLKGLAVASLLLNAACGGTVIKNIDPKNPGDAGSMDGILQSYYLPMADVHVTGSFAKGLLVSGVPAKPDLVADLDAEPLYLGYAHEGLSTENVGFKVGTDGLLQEVSSDTKSQAVDAINGVNNILQQFTNLQAQIAANQKLEEFIPTDHQKKPMDIGDCDGVSLDASIPVQAGTFKRQGFLNKGTSSCSLEAKVVVRALPNSGIPANNVLRVKAGKTLAETCKDLVCFRPQSPYEATVTLTLTGTTKDPNLTGVTKGGSPQTFRFLAPNRNYLGYVKFTRGVFAERTIDATFTSGVLTGFGAKRSSEVVGFLAVPAALLTTATLVAKIH